MLKAIYFISTDKGLFACEAESCAAAQQQVIEEADATPLKADKLEGLTKAQLADFAKRARFLGAKSERAAAQLAEGRGSDQQQAATRDDLAALLAGDKATISLP